MDSFLINSEKKTITSLELLEQINFFRWKEGENPTTHKDLLIIIETEFTGINRKRDEIRKCPGALSQIRELLEANGVIVSEYESPNNKRKYPMYILTLNQARQVLTRESRIVRGAMFEYIDKLEKNIKYLETERLGILERENKLLLKEIEVLNMENELLKSKKALPKISDQVIEQKNLKVTFYKSAFRNCSPRINVSREFLETLGITQEDRNIILKLDKSNKRLIIIKRK